MAELKPRSKFNQRFVELNNIQQQHVGKWKDIRDYQAPYRGNFIEDEGTQGSRKDLKIFNGTSGLSLRTIQAGLRAGIASPSRVWFRLAMADDELSERADVRDWLRQTETVLYRIFAKSNFYNEIALVFLETPAFGQCPLSIVADNDTVAHFEAYTIGEYFIATNSKKQVDVLYRRIYKTAAQLIEEFGKENVSQSVLNMGNGSGADQKVKIIHAVEPNDTRIPGMIDNKNKAYRSVYYEEDSKVDDNDFLSVSGFDTFPYAVPRWSVNGSDPYGTDQPGLVALGDAKQLQNDTLEKAKGLRLNMRPPLQATSDLRNARLVNIPGGVTFTNQFSGGGQGVRTLYENKVPLNDIRQDNLETEQRIRSAYYVDLFLAILSNNRPQDMKAEVAFQLDKERLEMLGPALESFNNDLLDPVIDRVFFLADQAGILPEAPEDLEGEGLKVGYVSSLARAQKLSIIGNMERLFGLVGSVEQLIPGTIDKLDGDQFVDEIGEVLGTPGKIIRSDEEVEEVRKAQAQSEAMNQALQASVAGAGAAKDLSQAKVGQGSVLDSLVGS